MSYIGQRPVVGRYIKLDQISSGFNGSETSFSMTSGSQAVFPGTARNLLLSLGGVIQEPDTNFTISGSTLTFTTAPVANTTFFAVIFGDMQSTGTPSDGTVLPASIASSGNFSFPQLTVTGTSSLGDDVTFTGANYNVVWDKSANSLEFADNALITLGTGFDLQIIHDGSNSRLKNNTGTLFLQSNGIKLKNFGSTEHYINCIDNGAVELYYDSSKKLETTNTGVTVTGALATTSLSATGGITGTGGNFVLGDSSGTSNNRIKLGASGDLQIYHDGSNSIISEQGTGDLTVNATSLNLYNNDIGGAYATFASNGAVELFHAGVKKFETTSAGVSVTGNLDLPDNTSGNASLRLGNSQDFFMNHNGTNSFIINNTGNLYIRDLNGNVHIQGKDAEEGIIVKADAEVELYYNNGLKFETISGGVQVTGELYADGVRVGDDEQIRFGDGEDLRLYHSGSHGILNNITGSFQVQDAGTEKFRVSGTGTSFKDDIFIANDNDKINIGASNDLQIYHNGTHSYIENATGGLYIKVGNGEFLNRSGNEVLGKFLENGAVELYYDNSKKLETTSTGLATESSSDVVFRITKTASSDAEIKNTGSLDLCCSSGGAGGQIIRFLTGANPSSLVEHMQINGGGHVLFNQSTTHVPGLANTTVGASMEDVGNQGSALFISRGDSIALFLNRNNTGQMVSFRQSGTEVGSISTNSHSLPSDRNFKKNITDLTLGLDFVNTLKPSKYNLKLEEDTDPLQFGLIAQDVEEALTAAGVSKNSIALCQHNPKEDEAESDYNLDYGKFVPILINAIKELSTKVAALEAA